uniref:Uncharacterized protein n=1 Tax=Micrurus paraensis TaxID=1970185 RepID=A0A2D4KF79_9SAUR
MMVSLKLFASEQLSHALWNLTHPSDVAPSSGGCLCGGPCHSHAHVCESCRWGQFKPRSSTGPRQKVVVQPKEKKDLVVSLSLPCTNKPPPPSPIKSHNPRLC